MFSIGPDEFFSCNGESCQNCSSDSSELKSSCQVRREEVEKAVPANLWDECLPNLAVSVKGDLYCIQAMLDDLEGVVGKLNLLKSTLGPLVDSQVVDRVVLLNASADVLDLITSASSLKRNLHNNCEYLFQNFLFLLNHPPLPNKNV